MHAHVQWVRVRACVCVRPPPMCRSFTVLQGAPHSGAPQPPCSTGCSFTGPALCPAHALHSAEALHPGALQQLRPDPLASCYAQAMHCAHAHTAQAGTLPRCCTPARTSRHAAPTACAWGAPPRGHTPPPAALPAPMQDPEAHSTVRP